MPTRPPEIVETSRAAPFWPRSLRSQPHQTSDMRLMDWLTLSSGTNASRDTHGDGAAFNQSGSARSAQNSSPPHYDTDPKPAVPSLNDEPGCIKVVDTFRKGSVTHMLTRKSNASRYRTPRHHLGGASSHRSTRAQRSLPAGDPGGTLARDFAPKLSVARQAATRFMRWRCNSPIWSSLANPHSHRWWLSTSSGRTRFRAGFWMLRRHGSSSLPATLGRHPSSPCTAADAESPTVRVVALTLLKAWVPRRLRDGLAIYDQRTLEGCPCLCRQSLADKEKADERFGSEPR